MATSHNKAASLLDFARGRPLFRAKEARVAGFSASTLASAVESGAIERVSRGTYRHAEAPWDEHVNLSEVLARVPKAIVVLVSALNFHGIGTQIAHSIYIQLRLNGVKPRMEYPPIEVVRTGEPRAFSDGIEVHQLNGIAVPITTPARTVADCFKYRSRLGLGLCLEAASETIRSGVTPAEIMKFARIARVQNVMLPYMEAMAFQAYRC